MGYIHRHRRGCDGCGCYRSRSARQGSLQPRNLRLEQRERLHHLVILGHSQRWRCYRRCGSGLSLHDAVSGSVWGVGWRWCSNLLLGWSRRTDLVSIPGMPVDDVLTIVVLSLVRFFLKDRQHGIGRFSVAARNVALAWADPPAVSACEQSEHLKSDILKQGKSPAP